MSGREPDASISRAAVGVVLKAAHKVDEIQ